MTGIQWNKVTLLGTGVIGGSIGRCLLHKRLSRTVVGVGRSVGRLDAARRAGVVNATTTSIAEGVAGADLVVACLPIDRIVTSLLEAAHHCPPECLLTDAASTKRSIVAELEAELPAGSRFVGSHPLAGSEKSGFEHARADLFEGRKVVLTPTPSTQTDVPPAVARFWQALGAATLELSPVEHDSAVAWVSHLPHAVAAILAACTPDQWLPLAATGWRDTTRVAAGDVELWTQIFTDNHQAVVEALDGYTHHLAAFRRALCEPDIENLQRRLAAGKQKRDAVAD